MPSTTINSEPQDKTTHLFGCLLLEPGTGLLDKGLIMTPVCAISDDGYDAVLEIFF